MINPKIQGVDYQQGQTYGYFDFRKKKRSLHEATARKERKEPNRTQKRNGKNTPSYQGFFLNDYMEVLGQNGYISGFTNNGAYVKKDKDNYVAMPNKKYRQVSISNLKLICHNNNWQYCKQYI